MPKQRHGKRLGALELEPRPRQDHLYLVFDDWSFGYTIRKVNTSNRFNPPVQRLPRPFFKLEAPHESPEYFASAFGTRILLMHPRDPAGHNLSGSFFPMLDVRSRSLTFGPGLEFPIHPVYLAVGNKLFIIAEASFEMLYLDPQSGSEWSWELLPHPPFQIYDVCSYALYGHSLLVSTENEAFAATFTFDTVKSSWKQLGKWVLPFEGRGHFDPLLGAFVGLSKDPDTLGQLICCYMHTSDTGHTLELKLSKEKLFSEDPALRHIGATLVYMESQSKFCLVECVSIVDDSADQELKEEEDLPQSGCCLCCLTTFYLCHDMNGDPTTGRSCMVQYYEVPRATSMLFLQDPVAFWM
ncbi:hypothetical protein CFC21_103223 [Triticum aestivum]|uniref:F-box associated domain-containing protein n=2 Tax=Triticum aestivum TaxID=4565 RepID=A0A3B6SLZ7_WHEAT|nr:uncharacterized protein LOC119336718 [Triticum dicoccoides]XP_037464683.1 uncharacterized protein LOC119336718 [Triticum dicoccoides]XP_044431454.1 uncharacterized protein LOC123157263 [Triticum aestivum]XP_044431455.1 uncharacterized protein LOC123157263 [Triticum aestivum]KAF7102028.1 hypothetical protein CFC21_103223 [Triticum aestivum]